MSNPYQDVIDWLRSPAGENWSEERMVAARRGARVSTAVTYGDPSVLLWKGILSVKTDDDPRTTAVFHHARSQQRFLR